MNKRVLVTGASGFVGRSSLPILASRGFEVHAVHSTGAPEIPATWHQADLHDRDQVGRLLNKVQPTHLLHFAWYAVHSKFWTSPENLRWVETSLALLRGFVDRGGKRAVLAGTCAEYDWSYGFCSESVTPLNPSTLYGVSKNALQSVVSAYAKLTGLSLAWGRIFLLYGAGEPPGRLVPSVIRSLLNKEVVRCSHGRQIRDFLHVDDCAGAFVSLLDSELEGPVNVASGQPISIRSVVNRLAHLVTEGGSPTIDFGAFPSPVDDPPMLVADVRRLGQELGWQPQLSLDQGLTQMVESFGQSER